VSDLTVANTILAQLGGSRVLNAMLGVKAFIGGENSLSFSWKARARDSINALRVVLDPSDTYTVEFLRIRNSSRVVVDTRSDVYCDGLVDLIQSRTGLALRMPRILRSAA
jgi:hypothetical protein